MRVNRHGSWSVEHGMEAMEDVLAMSRVPKIDVGTPPTDFPEWEIAAEVRFHRFSELPTTRNATVESPKFTCFGHEWSLLLFPGGDDDSMAGMVDIYLRHLSDEEITLQFGICVMSPDGKEEKECLSEPQTGVFLPISASETEYNARGFINYVPRSTIMSDDLVEGSLVIEVRMKLIEPAQKSSLPFVPENPLSKNILKKFMDDTTADVIFEVSCESNNGARDYHKRAKLSPVKFYAHRLVLIDSANTLAELCKGGDMTPVSITDVKPDIFRHLLYYVYGGSILMEDLCGCVLLDIIDAADKYAVVNLKLESEACYVQSTDITMGNVVEILMYADTKNCALLKEAVMDFLLENGGEAVEKLSFESMPGHIVKDLLTAVHMGKKQSAKVSNDYSTMRVSALRKTLHEKGLDVDGSREAMIALLKERSVRTETASR